MCGPVARSLLLKLAQAFVAYVLSPDGQTTLDRWGFLLPTATTPTPSAAVPTVR